MGHFFDECVALSLTPDMGNDGLLTHSVPTDVHAPTGASAHKDSDRTLVLAGLILSAAGVAASWTIAREVVRQGKERRG
jgi:hypothetical protein